MSKQLKYGRAAISVMLCILMLLAPISNVLAADLTSNMDAISKANKWLQGNQDAYGAWEGDYYTECIACTSQIGKYFKQESLSANVVSKAEKFLRGLGEEKTNNYLTAILAGAFSENYRKELINSLVSVQKKDGGWGLSDFYESDVSDTTNVLRTLIEENADINAIKKGIDYLLQTQKSDGSWSLIDSINGNICVTADVVVLFNQFSTVTGISSSSLESSLVKAGKYLESKKMSDGTWGVDNSHIVDTLIAYRAVLLTIGLEPVKTLEDTIIGLQNADGSWYEDAYITMLAAQALKERQLMPNAKINDIKLWSTASSGKVETYNYNSFEAFEIQVDSTTSNVDSKTNLYIKMPDGTRNSITSNGQATWNVKNNPPGEYYVEAIIKDVKTGRVMSSLDKMFTINPNFKIGNVLVSLKPHFTRVGKSVKVNAEVAVENHSNIDKPVEIRTTVYDGTNVITSDNKTIVLKASDVVPVSCTLKFDPDVSGEKNYIVRSEIYDGPNKVTEGQSFFKVLPGAGMQSYDFTLMQGEEAKQAINVGIPEMPPKADVIFSFDLTSSMGGILNTAKNKAKTMMNELNKLGVDINYGVVSYMDYNNGLYGSGGDYPYKLNCPLTESISSVSDSINSLYLGSGADGPESYTRIIYESYADGNIGWRNGAKKIFVNFGDNLPHDNNVNEGVIPGGNNTGVDPGRDGVISTSDDLDLQAVLANMASNNIELIACQTNGSYLNYWNYWAGLTGGKGYDTNSADLTNEVVNAVKTSLQNPNISNLRLVPNTGFDKWIDNTSPESYTGKTNTVVPFDVSIKVPLGTTKGMYSYSLDALDDNGVKYGTYNFNIDIVEDGVAPIIRTVVTTDKEQYSSNENVKFLATAKNITSSEASFKGKVEIIDSDGAAVKILDDNCEVHWTGGMTKELSYEWNTDKTIAGNYKVRLTWSDAGKVMYSAFDEFSICSDGQIKNSINTDKISYNANETANILQTVTNTSKNIIMADLIVKTEIEDKKGKVVWQAETPLEELLPGNTKRFNKDWNIGFALPGDYTAKSTVYGALYGQSALCSTSTDFEILSLSSTNIGIIGKIEASPKIIKSDGSIVLSRTISNIGNTDMTAVKRIVKIIEPSTGNTVDNITDTIDMAASKTVSDTITWKRAGLKTGSYIVSYYAGVPDGTQILLGSTGFKVEEPVTPSVGQSSSVEQTVELPTGNIPAIPPADLAISINADKTVYMEQDEITFTVKYKNLLKTGTPSFVITAEVPPNTTVSDAGDGKVEGNLLTWEIPGFIGESSGQRVYKVKVGKIPKSELIISDIAKIKEMSGLINAEDDTSAVKVMLRSTRYGDLSHESYILGYPDETFGPEREITRAEAAAILARIMNLSLRQDVRKIFEENIYTDVNRTHWADRYIDAVTNEGIFKGYKDNSFRPETKITRAELSVVIARYMNIKNIRPFEERYADIKGHWAQNYIEEINRLKLIQGYDDGTFRPDLYIKRSEAVTMINKMLFRGPLSIDSSTFSDITNKDWFFEQVEEAARDHKFTLDTRGNEVLIP